METDLGIRRALLIKLVYLLLCCAAVLSNTTVFAGQAYTLLEQANQFDMLMKLAQSGSVEAAIEPTVPAEPAEETAAEELAVEPTVPVEPAEEIAAEEAAVKPTVPAEPADEIVVEELAIEPEPEVVEEDTLKLQVETEIEPVPKNAAGGDACDEARNWYNEGLNLFDDSEQEAAYYKRAIELCPDFSAAHNRLGELYKSRGEYESALKEFNQAKKWSLLNEPGIDHRGNQSLLVDQFINQGKIYRMQGRYDMAAGQFKRALMINPDSRIAMNQLQYVNKMSGKYDNLLLPFLQSISSPIFTRTPGMALPKSIFSFGFRVLYWQQNADLTEDIIIGDFPLDVEQTLPFEREVDVLQVVLDLRYGLTDNITIGLFPRWSTIWTQMSPDSSAQDKTTGLGDTNFLIKYQLWATRKTRISLFHLLSIPTGDEDAESQGLGPNAPLGSGSFNFTPGIAFTTVKEYLEAPLTIHSNISYRFTNDEVVPDELRFDLATTYPFSPGINSIIELNYRWRDTFIHQQNFTFFRGRPPEQGGPINVDLTLKEKSGHTLFLSPGFQFILPKDIRLNVGVQIPLIKPEGGWAEKLVVNFGLRGFWDWW